ncbi:MAG: hypothetical protein CMH83_01790 [Nocardioides sp.]|nr:hypothetical protein [Nocardioides sp.]
MAAALATTALALTGCSDGGVAEPGKAPVVLSDADLGLCRGAEAVRLSVVGSDRALTADDFGAAVQSDYARAVDELTELVGAEGELDADVVTAVLGMVETYGRLRSYAAAADAAFSFEPGERRALLQRSEARHRQLLDACPDVLGGVDTSG